MSEYTIRAISEPITENKITYQEVSPITGGYTTTYPLDFSFDTNKNTYTYTWNNGTHAGTFTRGNYLYDDVTDALSRWQSGNATIPYFAVNTPKGVKYYKIINGSQTRQVEGTPTDTPVTARQRAAVEKSGSKDTPVSKSYTPITGETNKTSESNPSNTASYIYKVRPVGSYGDGTTSLGYLYTDGIVRGYSNAPFVREVPTNYAVTTHWDGNDTIYLNSDRIIPQRWEEHGRYIEYPYDSTAVTNREIVLVPQERVDNAQQRVDAEERRKDAERIRKEHPIRSALQNFGNIFRGGVINGAGIHEVEPDSNFDKVATKIKNLLGFDKHGGTINYLDYINGKLVR